jgi:hypothetical protein
MKQTTYILIIFTIVLIIIFFWGEIESLSFEQKIDDDKVGNFFTSFGGVVVAISLYYFYEQLKEMKSVNQPDLNISSAILNVTEEIGVIYNKKTLKFRQILDNKVSDLNSYFQLHNTGLGTCKNISIKWIYDLKKIKEILQDNYENFPIFITESQYLSFLESNGKVQIEIPEFYFYCCAPEFNFNEKNHSELAKKLIQGEDLQPKLNVEVKYYDIKNVEIIKNFKVEVQAVNNTIKVKFKHI